MKRMMALVLTLTLLWTCGNLPALASSRPIAAKAFTVKNVVYLDIAAGSIAIGAKYVTQAGEVFSHKNKFVLTGTSTTNTVSVAENANVTVTVDDLAIRSDAANACPFAIAKGASVNLRLAGRNRLVQAIPDSPCPALGVPEGASLTISGTGSLYAAVSTSSVQHGGAGIGGGNNASAGTITIKSGTVSAVSCLGAGIGSGMNGTSGTSGTITVAGGSVDARSRQGGAGIGGGKSSAGGVINITGGHVTVASMDGAGIGGGYNGAGGVITITGGTVADDYASRGSGIGGGYNGAGGKIRIKGGNIRVTAGSGAGIGGGDGGAGGDVSITGGTIHAESNSGAGIGGGRSGAGGNISITGGKIYAASFAGAGNGAGVNGTGGVIKITGGAVTAKSDGDNAAGIGAQDGTVVLAKNAVRDCGSGILAKDITLLSVKLAAEKILADGTLTLSGKNALSFSDRLSEYTAPTVSFNALAGTGTLTIHNLSGSMPGIRAKIAVDQSKTVKNQSRLKLGGGFSLVDTAWDANGVWAVPDIPDAEEVYLVTAEGRESMSFKQAGKLIGAAGFLYTDGSVAQAKIVLRRDVSTDADTLPLKPCTIDGQGFFTVVFDNVSDAVPAAADCLLSNITFINSNFNMPCSVQFTGKTLTLKNVTLGEVRAPAATVAVSGINTISGFDAATLTLQKARLNAMERGMRVSKELRLTGANRMAAAMGGGTNIHLTGDAKSTGKGTLVLDLGNDAVNETQFIYVSEQKQTPKQARIQLGAGFSKYELKAGPNEMNYKLVLKDASVARVKKGKKNVGFDSFEKAIEYINQKKLSGATVTLYTDATLTASATLSYPATIDLGKHTLRSSAQTLTCARNVTVKNGTCEPALSIAKGATLTTMDLTADTIAGEGALSVRASLDEKRLNVPSLTLNKAQVTLSNNAAFPQTCAVVLRLIGVNTWTQQDINATTPCGGLKITGSGKLTVDCEENRDSGRPIFRAGAGTIDPGVMGYLLPGDTLGNYTLAYSTNSVALRAVF